MTVAQCIYHELDQPLKNTHFCISLVPSKHVSKRCYTERSITVFMLKFSSMSYLSLTVLIFDFPIQNVQKHVLHF